MFYAFHKHSKESYEKSHLELMVLRQEMEWKHHEKVTELNEEHGSFVHNIANQLKVLEHLANQNDVAQMASILQELNVDMRKTEKKLYTQHPILNIILSEKAAEAERQGVAFQVNVEPSIYVERVRDTDLIIALGNLLDNAIRGASEYEGNKELMIRAFMQNDGNFFVIKITNGFNGNIRKEKGRFLSTKKKSGIHGIGIKSVEEIAIKYNGNLKCTVRGNEFQALLILSTL